MLGLVVSPMTGSEQTLLEQSPSKSDLVKGDYFFMSGFVTSNDKSI